MLTLSLSINTLFFFSSERENHKLERQKCGRISSFFRGWKGIWGFYLKLPKARTIKLKKFVISSHSIFRFNLPFKTIDKVNRHVKDWDTYLCLNQSLLTIFKEHLQNNNKKNNNHSNKNRRIQIGNLQKRKSKRATNTGSVIFLKKQQTEIQSKILYLLDWQ